MEGEDKYTRVQREKEGVESEEDQISEAEIKKQIERLKKSKVSK